MGARGLREAAEVSMINNQYLEKKLLEVRGVTKPYSTEKRVDQIRFSLERMRDETGVGVGDFNRRVIDYGIQSFFTSHHPWIVPEPFTPEPCETYSKADIDHWVSVVRRVSEEAYSDPELVKTAPHNAAIHTIDPSPFNDPERWAMTWRAHLKKGGKDEPTGREGGDSHRCGAGHRRRYIEGPSKSGRKSHADGHLEQSESDG